MSILASLAEIGRIFADKAKAKSEENNTPEIKFFVGQPTQTGEIAFIEITASHPAVRAYEWGSGIHATKGTPETYPIVPKNKTYLAFMWPKVDGDPSFRRLPDGRVLLKQVSHPGVAARPFLAPTVEDTKVEFRKILGQGFKAELLAGTEKVEVIEVK